MVSIIIVLEGFSMFDGKCYGYVNTLLQHISSYKWSHIDFLWQLVSIT